MNPPRPQTGSQRLPEVLASARSILARYDVIFSDVWGVVHDGFRAFAPACDALERFRAAGGTVILVSNAPVPAPRVAEMLDARRVPREAWDHIVSSGEIALAHIRDSKLSTAYYIGPRDRDEAFFARAEAASAAIEVAEALVCTGLNDDMREAPDDYKPLLETALGRRLPFVCANPDLVVDVGGRLFPCAGALADLYEGMGGEVFWAGKPHAAAYIAAGSAAESLRGAPVAPSQVLVIGDALRTDLAGAEAQGIDAMFIGSGIHRHDAMTGDTLDPGKLARLFGPGAPGARFAMPVLAW